MFIVLIMPFKFLVEIGFFFLLEESSKDGKLIGAVVFFLLWIFKELRGRLLKDVTCLGSVGFRYLLHLKRLQLLIVSRKEPTPYIMHLLRCYRAFFHVL